MTERPDGRENMKRMLPSIGLCYFSIFIGGAAQIDDPQLRLLVYALSVVYIAVLGVLYMKVSKKSPKEIRRQRTRELEQELGLEPMNLEELDPIFEEIEKNRKEK